MNEEIIQLKDIWLQKIDHDGNTVWYSEFTISGSQSVRDLVLDDSNNVYLCGSSAGDYIIMKVNADGSLAWEETFDYGYGADVANAICVDDAGNVYATGEAAAGDGSDVVSVKYDNAGNYVFDVSIADSGVSLGSDIECIGGDIYVFGTTNSNGLNLDMVLIKYETVLGIHQWTELMNGSGYANDYGVQMIVDGMEFYLLGNSAQSGGSGWSIAKFDTNGDEYWMEDFFTGETDFSGNQVMAFDPAGFVYIAATISAATDYCRVLQIGAANGNQLWSSDFTAINDTHFSDIATTSQGKILLSGTTLNNSGNMDIFIEHMDNAGDMEWWGVYDGCGGNDDTAIGLLVNSDNEAIVSGYNNQASSLMFSALIEPDADFTATASSVCSGETVTFNDTSEGSALSYDWDFGPGAEPATANDGGPHDVEYSSAGTKLISLTITNSLGSSSVDYTIDVLAAPELSISADAEICFGLSTIISASGSGTITWDNGLGEGDMFNVSPEETTSYTATVIDDNQCENTSTLIVTVNDLPSADAGEDTEMCSGESYTLEATGGSNYTWDNDLGAGSTHEVSPIETTTYTVDVENEFGCLSSDQVLITVLESPIANAGDDAEICLGELYTLVGSGGSTYNWEGLGEGQSQEIQPNHTDIYILTVTSSNDCSNTDEVTITVNPLPNVNAGDDVEICTGESATLHAVGGETYEWDNGIGEGQTQEVEPLINTTYIVTASDLNLCQNSDTVVVTVNPLPAANAGPDQEICPGETTTISASGGDYYDWDQGLGEGQGHDVSPETSTVYTVTVYNDFNCGAEDDIEVVVFPIVNLEVDGLSDDPYCNTDDAEYVLSATPSGGSFSGPGITGESFSPSAAGIGNHEILYEYTDDNECEFSLIIDVEVELCDFVSEIDQSISLFPNPTSGMLYIQSSTEMGYEQKDIQTIDALGQLVNVEITKSENSFAINMDGLAKGVYFIRIENDTLSLVKSVVVE